MMRARIIFSVESFTLALLGLMEGGNGNRGRGVGFSLAWEVFVY